MELKRGLSARGPNRPTVRKKSCALSHKLLPVGHELTCIFAARNHHLIDPLLISRHDIRKRTCFTQPCSKFGAKFDLGSRTRHDRLAHLLNYFGELVLGLECYIADCVSAICFSTAFVAFFKSVSKSDISWLLLIKGNPTAALAHPQ